MYKVKARVKVLQSEPLKPHDWIHMFFYVDSRCLLLSGFPMQSLSNPSQSFMALRNKRNSRTTGRFKKYYDPKLTHYAGVCVCIWVCCATPELVQQVVRKREKGGSDEAPVHPQPPPLPCSATAACHYLTGPIHKYYSSHSYVDVSVSASEGPSLTVSCSLGKSDAHCKNTHVAWQSMIQAATGRSCRSFHHSQSVIISLSGPSEGDDGMAWEFLDLKKCDNEFININVLSHNAEGSGGKVMQ